MDEKKVKKENNTLKVKKDGFGYLVYAFSEAFNVTASLVFFPIVLVLLGVFVDKTFNTKPLFIIIGMILGIIIGVWQAIKVTREKLPAHRASSPEGKT